MEERANEMFDKAIKEAMTWLKRRDDAIFRDEAERSYIMANYWFGYAAGILQLMEPQNEKKGNR